MFDTNFKRSLTIAAITDLADFTFHFFLTNPMESITYFVIKFLLAFFVAEAMYSLSLKKIWMHFMTGLAFSTLMSIYYRAWEMGEAHMPFGSRAPDLIGIARNSILFPMIWWLGHASFFFIGVIVANRIFKK